MSTSRPEGSGVSDGRSEDNRPSIQVAMAAALLRRGRSPARVAQLTAVPLAMVTLLAEEQAQRRATPDRSTAPGLVPIWVSITAGVSVLLDIGVATAATAVHVTVLAWLSLFAAAPLLALLILTTIARRGARAHMGTSGRALPRKGDRPDGSR
jgi:hypothetical protein